ncbi:MAG: hypothetical protein LBJ58_07175 [Tannerellaceae bacterium]|nr:hypothetical protein [Tannerellaceae bacterium]
MNTGCVQEETPVPVPPASKEQEMVTLYFRDASSAATRALNDSIESVVKDIDVLIFKSEYSQLKFSQHIAVSENDIRVVSGDYTKKEFTIIVPKDFDYYRYVIIANAHSEVDGYIKQASPAGQLKDDLLRNIISENTGLWNTTPGSSGFKLIPMWGESEGVRTTSQLDKNEIKLYRSLARVDVKVDESVAFDLKEIYVYNRPSRGRIAPDIAFWNDSQKRFTAPSLPANLGIVDKANNNNNVYNVNGKKFIQEIYLYETEEKSTQDYINATCLVLGGMYNGAMNYYRVDFAELSEASTGSPDSPSGEWWKEGPPSSGTGSGGMVGAGDIYHPLVRNYHYEIAIVAVKGAGSNNRDNAVRSINTQLVSEFLTWDNNNQNVIIDNTPYTLTVDPSTADLSQQNATKLITLTTSYPNPKWTLGEPSVDWFKCSLDAANNKVTVSLNTSVTLPASGSEGYFRINLIGNDGKHKVGQQIKVTYK